MKKLLSLFTIVFALLATFIRVDSKEVNAADATVLNVVADTHISPAANADLNFGKNPNMAVRSRATKDKNYYESLLKFNIPAGVSYVAQADLTLTYNTVPANLIGRKMYIYTTDASWIEGLGNVSGVESEVVEGRVTYNTAPAKNPADSFVLYEFVGSLPTKGDTVTIDVKDIVNAYLTLDGVVGSGETAISFNMVSAQTVNELELGFRTKENTNGGAATLTIAAGDSSEEGILKDQFASLETNAQLNFGMEYSSVASQVEERLLACATVTTTMNKNNNFAEQFGVDPEIFNVNAILNGATSFPSINKAGYVRLYADTNDGIGNAFQVKLQDETKVITSVSFRTDNGDNLVLLDANGNNIALTNDGDVYSATLNSNMFAIQNNNSEKIIPNIYEIDITYEGLATQYTAFNNVDMRFVAEIPTELLESIESYGFDLTVNGKTKNVPVSNMSDEEDGKSFAVVVRDIKAYDVEITGVAYVVVGGEKIALQSKTYSVLSIIEKYINDAESLSLTSTQIDALNAFKALNA